MKQFTSIAQLVNASPFLSEWSGINQQVVNGICIKTSNRLLLKYHSEGVDNLINSVTLKQLMSYETYSTLYDILSKGIVIKYQSQSMSITLIKSNLKVTIENLKTNETHTFKISKTNINKVSRIINNVDSIDTLQSIYNRMVREGV